MPSSKLPCSELPADFSLKVSNQATVCSCGLAIASSSPIAYLAAIAADIIPVPISVFLTEPEVARIIEDVSPRLIVAEEGLALPAEPACPVLPAKAMRDMYGLAPAPYAMGEPDRAAYIIYTSGTSGRSRAVVHAHRVVWRAG